MRRAQARFAATAMACALAHACVIGACGIDLYGTAPANAGSEGGIDSGANVDGAPAARAADDGGNVDLGDARLADGALAKPELSLMSMSPPNKVDLETEGTRGWIHWGLSDKDSKNEKQNALGAIPTFTLTGSTDYRTYSDNLTEFTWTNGAPTANQTGTTNGVYSKTGNPTFTLKRKAGLVPLRLVLYAGVYEAKGHLEVKLGTGPADPTPVSAELDDQNHGYARFVIDFRAVDPATELEVTWQMITLYDENNSNVTLAAATLMPRP